MKREVRIVSLLRWTVVAMHTAFLASVLCCPALTTMSKSEREWNSAVELCLLLVDFPAVILASLPATLMPEGSLASGVIFVLLGGLQWYLIASLLARMTFGFQRSIPLASKRFILPFLASLLLVAGCGIIPWIPHWEHSRHPRTKGPYTEPDIAFNGDSTDLHQSIIVPTLDTPVPEGKNVIWCGTLQLAWNHLEEDVLHEPPNLRGAEAVAQRLNEAQFTEDDLPPDSYLAEAGFAKDGIVERIKSEMASRFHKTVEIDPLEPSDILAYAYLEAKADFTVPYFDSPEPLTFLDPSGRETPVTSFGIEEKHEYAYEQLRDQLDVLYRHPQNLDSENPDEFVLDLCRSSSPNQVIVARIPRKATLSETLADMDTKIREFARQSDAKSHGEFGINDVLMIPNLNWEVQHRFTELEGSDKPFQNDGFTGYHIVKALQTIRFRMDRSGAELASEARLPCAPTPTHYLCNRPFLIVMKKRDTERPFFVMWVDNAELLSKPTEPLLRSADIAPHQ